VTDGTHIRFGGWTLARASGELTRDGNTVLWPRGIVDFDNGLNAVVRKLRTVLDDDAETPRYIETLPRIGYRFIGKVDALAEPAAVVATALPKGPVIRHPVLGLLLFFAAVIGMTLFLRHDRQADVPSVAAPAAGNTTVPRRTTNERAYDLYLQGIFNRSRRDINGTTLARENFQAALKLDPYYADAWAGLSETESGSALAMTTPLLATYERARSAALRAIELADDEAHGHAALANIYMHFDRDFAKAEAELDRARALDTSYGRIWHTTALLRAFQGRMPEAFDAMGRARELEPMTLLYNTNYGLLLFESRRYDEAIAHVKLLLSSQPRLDHARTILIRALVAKGDIDAALEQLPLRVNDRPTLADAGLVYAHAGRVADARAEIERIERIGKEGFGVAYDVAIVEAALGRLPEACAALNRAIADHSLRLLYMRLEPSMDPVRGEPCFKDIERKLYGD
jgi:tetratricopeptide (TPR) repeat protein